MPETASIFDALPTTDALNLSPASVPGFTPPKLDGIDSLAAGIGAAATGAAGGGGPALPDLSGAPSPSAFRRGLDEPLSRLAAIDAKSLAGNVKSVAPPRPAGAVPDVNGVAQQITSKVLPAGAGAPVDANVKLPAALGDFGAPLRRLAEAGAATPLRMLHVLLTVLDRLVATAADAEQIKSFTAEALSEILVAQTDELRGRLPSATLARAKAALDADYFARFEALLAGLEAVKAASGPELGTAVRAARGGALPTLKHFGAAAETLTLFRASDTAALERALKNVAGFATADEVFLKPTFDAIEARVAQVLDAVAAPVIRLSEMIAQISRYLNDAANLADKAAQDAAAALETGLRTISGYLDGARAHIEQVAEQVKAFVEKVDVAPALEAFKRGCAQVVDGVDRFFTQVEAARKKLDDTVADLSAKLEKRFDDDLEALQARIRELLKQITDLLDRAEVKQVLDQARQGVEKLKGAIDQASLQAVFDVVIRKTGELEGRIQAIDTARLGTPQKTALKVGAKVIEAVNVDEIVKPELQAAFSEIVAPLRELISLLKDRVLVVEQRIDAFAPGTLLADTLDPLLRPLFDALDGFRPSALLQPVKDALGTLQGVVAQLDPDVVVAKIQGAYEQLRELVDALEPTPLTAEIQRAANTAIARVTEVRDVHLEELLKTIRDNASLSRLLEGTGIQEVADAQFWEMLRSTLGGEYLDRTGKAMDDVEARLAAEMAGFDYSAAAAAAADASRAVNAQVAMTQAAFAGKVAECQTALGAAATRIGDLERRRRALVEGGTVERPEVLDVLRQMALEPALDLLAALGAVAAMADADVKARHATVKERCRAYQAGIAAMDEDAIRQAAPSIFKAQVGEPVRGFIGRVREKLKPFADAVAAIQGFVKQVLVELPKRIDASVGKVLDALRTTLRAVATEAVAAIRTARDALVGAIGATYEKVRDTVGRLDPTLVLNSFVLADFVGTGEKPSGLLSIARRIASPGDDEAAALLQARLTTEQVELVRGQQGGFATPVLLALNGVLRDEAFAGHLLAGARARLDAEGQRHRDALKTAEGDAYVEARKGLIRTLSLGRQLEAAERARASSNAATRGAGTVRMNRILLEIQYPAGLKMSLQGLHPYVVEMVGQLYPTETVERVDRTYAEMVARLHGVPEKLLKEPLDEAFATVKDKLHATFDIRGLFRVLDIKLGAMEGDLAKGLDRLSLAYDHLLGTLDARLSA